jgi:hypothetical protein
MADGPDHPFAVAMQWVGRIFAAVLMMCLPVLGGQMLDRRWGTHFIGVAGFVIGLVVGVAYLIAFTQAAEAERRRKRDAANLSARNKQDK